MMYEFVKLNFDLVPESAAKTALEKIHKALFFSWGDDALRSCAQVFAELKRSSPKTYQAFEACTDDSYFIWVDEDKHKMERRLEGVLDLAGIVPDTTITGTVTADSIEGAIEAVRAGNWG